MSICVRRLEIGVRRSVSKVLAEHKRLGVPIVVLQDGKIIKIQPEDIVVPHYPTDDEIIDD